MTYQECRDKAQRAANATGYDYGVEKNAFGFTSFMLPQRKNRVGHELRCEVVSCSDLSRCKPGHGPNGWSP